MSKRIVSGIMLTLLLISSLNLVPSSAQEDEVVIRIEPNTQTVYKGASFNVTIRIENMPADPGVAGVQFRLYWDSSVLTGVSMEDVLFHTVTPGDKWNNIWQVEHVVTDDHVWYAYTWLNYSKAKAEGYAPISGNHTLAVITFDATALGSTILNFTVAKVGDPPDPPDYESVPLPSISIGGSVTVARSPWGPRLDNLLIKYFQNSSALFDALKSGEVDLTNWPLTQAQMDEVFNDTNIQAAISPTFGMFEFDFNNNATTPTYPSWTNPTAYKGLRQGIACLVDKNHIVDDICNYSYRIDTPIPRPNGDWCVDWSVSQYDAYGNLLGNYPYEHNSTAAAYYFDLAGFVEGYENNTWYDPEFPGSAQYLRISPETNETLAPLIFYIRDDDPKRLEGGRILRDNLRKMGIPVNATEASLGTCMNKVMQEGDYHIYTGGWRWEATPPPNGFEFLAFYSSEYITEGLMVNYPQFRNATYDEWAKKATSPSSLTIARDAALKCQRILVEEAVCVWLWSPSWVMGYRNIYGVVNLRGGSIDNQWTFLKARNGEITEICYGLGGPPYSLNVVTDYSLRLGVSECLDPIYDTLLSYCPYDTTPARGGRTMPWMAEDWEVGEWESPYEPGKNLTKLTFYLRDGIKWHDGVVLNSTDVKFTIEYLQGLGNLSALYSFVFDVHHVKTPNARTVVVYENVSNIWTLDYIGTLPILPKHIFQNIVNVTGYTPGASQGLPANETLIGSGPWKYVYNNSSMLYLEANPDYFMKTPPEAEVDFRYDWEMGCWAVDAMDASMIGRAYGSSGNGVPDTNWEPGCDIKSGDCRVDLYDVLAVGLEFNATWGKSAKRYMPEPPTDTTIHIETSENPILVGEILTVYVKLENFVSLSGLQFKLNYDNAKLECLNISLTPIFESSYEAKKEINQSRGFVWVSISSLGSPVSGNKTLATMYFNATKPSGSALDLWNTKLASYGAPGSTCQLMVHKAVDRGVMVGVSTPSGTNVTVAPAENANVTFAETTTEGVTTLNITQPPSTEFVSVLCHDIKTTANHTGNITIQFAYDPSGLSLEDEQSMKIWLWNETSGSWVDITTFVDTENNIIYGVTPHLSIFGVTWDLSISFAQTILPGQTTVKVLETAPDPPTGLVVAKYYTIETTAIYQGPVTIRLAYDGQAIPPEEAIFVQIWQWDEPQGEWLDATTSVDTVHSKIYAQTSHLSIFGVTSLAPLPEEIAVLDATCSKTAVAQGCNVTISFIIENQGGFTIEDLNVTVYCNSTILATQLETLGPIAGTFLTFTWDTTNWAKGHYAVSVWDHLIGWVSVTVPGDTNGDEIVDIFDAIILATAFGSKPNDAGWKADADINCDDIVDIFDAIILATNFGKKA